MKNITKTIVVFIAILAVTLSGCGLRRVEYIGNTSIQTSDDDKELYLFFALLDGNKKEMSALQKFVSARKMIEECKSSVNALTADDLDRRNQGNGPKIFISILKNDSGKIAYTAGSMLAPAMMM